MRLALGLEYSGAAYFGWQKQEDPALTTIQSLVEQAVSSVADESIEVVCSGRTDRGVHAFCQVAHFDTKAIREEKGWVMGINHFLPPDIRVLWVKPKSPEFHARYSAVRRSYLYLIDNRSRASALFSDRSTWVFHRLNEKLMHESGQCLLGEHDFSAFRAVGCQSKSVLRSVSQLSVKREGHFVMLNITANAFLYHMVRNIVGSLILVGHEERSTEWMKTVLQSCDRKLAGPTAEATGLYFVGPEY